MPTTRLCSFIDGARAIGRQCDHFREDSGLRSDGYRGHPRLNRLQKFTTEGGEVPASIITDHKALAEDIEIRSPCGQALSSAGYFRGPLHNAHKPIGTPARYLAEDGAVPVGICLGTSPARRQTYGLY